MAKLNKNEKKFIRKIWATRPKTEGGEVKRVCPECFAYLSRKDETWRCKCGYEKIDSRESCSREELQKDLTPVSYEGMSRFRR